MGILANHRQCCLSHVPHELKTLVKYQEKAAEEDIKYSLNQVHSIFQLNVPFKDIKDGSIKEKFEINEKKKAMKRLQHTFQMLDRVFLRV